MTPRPAEALEAHCAAFWSWAVAVYERPGVGAAALALQDEHGANVNLLLALCWLAQRHGRDIDPACRDEVLGALEPFSREITAPVRRARQALKPLAADEARIAELRARVKALELDLEREEQRLILAVLAQRRYLDGRASRDIPEEAPSCAMRSLALYAEKLISHPQERPSLEARLGDFLNLVFAKLP